MHNQLRHLKTLILLLVTLLMIVTGAACGQVGIADNPSNQSSSFDTNATIEEDDSSQTDESDESENRQEESSEDNQALPDRDGIYDSRDEVALYIHVYDCLPSNYISKKEAKKLGWNGGSLEKYAPGKCIGGDRFGNYEGNLPDATGRSYTECDIDTLGKDKRGAKRIVFSNDGLIYYTEDHYETFTLLYGEE